MEGLLGYRPMRHCNGVAGGSAVSEERWFKQQRMDWIAETLRIFGFINREHLMKKFGISKPQASNDLATFREDYPDLITYDTSKKKYLANQNTK